MTDASRTPVASRSRAADRALTAAALVVVAGCAARTVEHDEGSHALPPHHPVTFRRAVDEIERRGNALLGGPDPGSRAAFADIVGWLPTLAADTELGRADWERVAAAARALEGFPGNDAAGTLAEAVTGLRGAVAALPRVVTAARDEEGEP